MSSTVSRQPASRSLAGAPTSKPSVSVRISVLAGAGVGSPPSKLGGILARIDEPTTRIVAPW